MHSILMCEGIFLLLITPPHITTTNVNLSPLLLIDFPQNQYFEFEIPQDGVYEFLSSYANGKERK